MTILIINPGDVEFLYGSTKHFTWTFEVTNGMNNSYNRFINLSLETNLKNAGSINKVPLMNEVKNEYLAPSKIDFGNAKALGGLILEYSGGILPFVNGLKNSPKPSVSISNTRNGNAHYSDLTSGAGWHEYRRWGLDQSPNIRAAGIQARIEGIQLGDTSIANMIWHIVGWYNGEGERGGFSGDVELKSDGSLVLTYEDNRLMK